MINYSNLIGEEKRYIDELKAQIEIHQSRLEALEAWQQSGVSARRKTDGRPQGEIPSVGFRAPARRLSDVSLYALSRINGEPKQLKDVEEECKKAGYEVTRQSVGAQMRFCEEKFGYVERVDPGFYRLTERGLAYVKEKAPQFLEERLAGAQSDATNEVEQKA